MKSLQPSSGRSSIARFIYFFCLNDEFNFNFSSSSRLIFHSKSALISSFYLNFIICFFVFHCYCWIMMINFQSTESLFILISTSSFSFFQFLCLFKFPSFYFINQNLIFLKKTIDGFLYLICRLLRKKKEAP